uniref:CHY-type domain-containing protein n=1 Tax=Oryza punctata TaxID=4537 RepID=A0A0E0K8R0_ORYPU
MEVDLAVEQYGRKCKIRAPCCGEIFDCRHCHNEVKDSLEVSISDRHEIPRHEIKLVICSLCNKEQDVQQDCSNCGACLGKYFCAKCNFYDDDVSKNQFHCDGCGICRTGGADNFFHCDKCGCCYSYVLKDSHHCVERAMHHNCPVCFEYLFDSTKDISALHCGHTIHLECLYEMRSHKHIADASDLSEEDDMDPLQRLWDDIKRAIPHIGTQVPRMQLLQHPADKSRPCCRVLQSLKNSEMRAMQCSLQSEMPNNNATCEAYWPDFVFAGLLGLCLKLACPGLRIEMNRVIFYS